MKKIILICMLMLAASVAVLAQGLTGKQWCTVLTDDDGEDIAVALTFEKDGTCEMLIAAQQEMKEDGVPITLTAAVSVPGTYRLDGKNLNTKFVKSKAQVEVDYDIKGLDPKVKAKMDKEIRAEINSTKAEFKKVLVEGMPKMDNLKIVSLDKKQLVVKNDDNQEIPFYVE